MQRTLSEKNSNGKIIRVSVDFADKIKSVKIAGDFSVKPADALGEIEKSLVGLSFSTNEDLIRKKIDYTVKKLGAELKGLDPALIAKLIKIVVRQ